MATLEEFTKLAATYRRLLHHMSDEQLAHAEQCNSCVPHGAALSVLIEKERQRRARVATRLARKSSGVAA